MPEYRAIREKNTMLEVINSPELSAEVTLQPINKFDLDAAIMFSDILPPLVGMGLDLDFVKGSGPLISNPIQSAEDVAKLTDQDVLETMGPTLEAIRLVTRELTPRGIPLIGFAGAPFTLACYAIQGSGSKMYEKAKGFMYSHPDAWKNLMSKMAGIVAEYMIGQYQAGAVALQLFDSWAGVLSRADYQRFLQPYNRMVFEKVAESTDVPLINFSTGTGTHTETVAETGGSVVGVDWRLPIDEMAEKIGDSQAIQGNLDPTLLLGPWSEIESAASSILEKAPSQGHVFNLGHGILPPTPMESVTRLVDFVHEKSSR